MQPPIPGAVAEISARSSRTAARRSRSRPARRSASPASKDAVPALVGATKVGKERVGVAAADALMLIKDPSAAPALIAMLNGGTWRTQVAAINASRCCASRNPIVAPHRLPEGLRQGRPREDARVALEGITTMDFGLNGARWEEWWNGVKDDLESPAAARQEEGRRGRREGRPVRPRRARLPPHEDHEQEAALRDRRLGVDARSDPDQARAQRGPSGPTKASPKLDLAREELARTLRTLDEHTNFNVIAFESDIRFFKKEAVAGTAGNIQEAIQWVEKQKPRTISSGGVTAVERHRLRRHDDGPHEHVRRPQGRRSASPTGRRRRAKAARPVPAPRPSPASTPCTSSRTASRPRARRRTSTRSCRTSSSGTGPPAWSSTRSG